MFGCPLKLCNTCNPLLVFLILFSTLARTNSPWVIFCSRIAILMYLTAYWVWALFPVPCAKKMVENPPFPITWGVLSGSPRLNPYCSWNAVGKDWINVLVSWVASLSLVDDCLVPIECVVVPLIKNEGYKGNRRWTIIIRYIICNRPLAIKFLGSRSQIIKFPIHH